MWKMHGNVIFLGTGKERETALEKKCPVSLTDGDL